MNRLYPAICLGLLWLGLALSACENEPNIPFVPKPNRVILIPTEMSLEQAADSAAAGDTLEVTFVGTPIRSTLVFTSGQTPLVFRGVKDVGAITSLGTGPLVRFENPRAGTRLEGLAFGGGSPSLSVTGGGTIALSTCRFFGGDVQVALEGGVRAEIGKNLFRNAVGSAVTHRGGGSLTFTGNTVHAPGEAGLDVDGGTVSFQNNLLHQAGTYGIRCTGSAALADSSGCNNVFLSTVADYFGCEAQTGDFSQDPQFCDAATGDFTLVSTSPCAPINSGGCDLVGALPVGCDPEPPTGASGPRPRSR